MMTAEDLKAILASHAIWLSSDGAEGSCAILSGADLSGADLSGANLRGADLSGANLRDANLSGASLRDAYLIGASMRRAILSGADLSGANLSGANLRGADLSGANLRDANLSGASLRDANLRGADLRDANLRGADLRDANLRGADLREADLRDANLRGAKGIQPEICTPLLMLIEQPELIRAYKLVTASGEGPFNGGITYTVGQHVECDDADTDPAVQCGRGINVATLDWCLHEWRPTYRILIVEFTAADIAAIPTATDGKFRLHRCFVVGEKVIDPIALGLVKAEQASEGE